MEQLLVIIAALALLGLTIVWIVRPLLQGQTAGGERSPEARTLAELSAQHEATLKSLRDLDTDYTTGKLNEDDYQAQRQVFLAEGVAILQRLDALKAGVGASDPALDKAIEDMVAARRAVPDVAPTRVACPNCGATVRPMARFCDQCGAALQPAPPRVALAEGKSGRAG